MIGKVLSQVEVRGFFEDCEPKDEYNSHAAAGMKDGFLELHSTHHEDKGIRPFLFWHR